MHSLPPKGREMAAKSSDGGRPQVLQAFAITDVGSEAYGVSMVEAVIVRVA